MNPFELGLGEGQGLYLAAAFDADAVLARGLLICDDLARLAPPTPLGVEEGDCVSNNFRSVGNGMWLSNRCFDVFEAN